MLDKNLVYHGDCLELMEDIDDKSIDMILCDLPYGTTKCKWDVVIPFKLLWEQYERIIKDNGAIVLFSSGMFTADLMTSNKKLWKYNWVWDKVKPNGHLVAKHRPMQRTEDICVFSKNSCIYNPQMIPRDRPKKSKEYSRTTIMSGNQTNFEERVLDEKYPQNVIVVSNASQRNKLHPTQKPVPLCEYLIKTYTQEGELVLDNCCGSGTTAVACLNTNRNFICIEKELKYVQISNQRIQVYLRDEIIK